MGGLIQAGLETGQRHFLIKPMDKQLFRRKYF